MTLSLTFRFKNKLPQRCANIPRSHPICHLKKQKLLTGWLLDVLVQLNIVHLVVLVWGLSIFLVQNHHLSPKLPPHPSDARPVATPLHATANVSSFAVFSPSVHLTRHVARVTLHVPESWSHRAICFSEPGGVTKQRAQRNRKETWLNRSSFMGFQIICIKWL